MTRIPAYFVGSILAFGSVLFLVHRIDCKLDGDRRGVWIPSRRSLISVNIMRWTGYSWASVIFYVGSRWHEKRVRWLRAR